MSSRDGRSDGGSRSATVPDDLQSTRNSNDMTSTAHAQLFESGLQVRKEVLGEEYVKKSLDGATEFSMPMQELATEFGWSAIWARPGLSRSKRSILNLGMLTALARWTELGTHIRGALRNGVTLVELREALLQASAYCGLPAGLEAFRVAERVLGEMREKSELQE